MSHFQQFESGRGAEAVVGARGQHAAVAGGQDVLAEGLTAQFAPARQHEEEQELATVRARRAEHGGVGCRHGRDGRGPQHPDPAQALGGPRDAGVAGFEAGQPRGPPGRRGGDVADELLRLVQPLRQAATGGQRHLGVAVGLVDGGAAELHHLGAGRRFEHPVADLGRLQHAVAGVQDEGLALVLVDQPDPARLAEDHLEPDPVVVHVVRHRPAGRKQDVGGHEAPVQTRGDQVAVEHAGAADAPALGPSEPRQHEFLDLRRNGDGGVGVDQIDHQAVRSEQLRGRAGGQQGRLAEQAKTGRARRAVGGGLEPQRAAMGAQHGDARGLGGHDQPDLEAEPAGEEFDRGAEVRAAQHELGRVDGRGERNGRHA